MCTNAVFDASSYFVIQRLSSLRMRYLLVPQLFVKCVAVLANSVGLRALIYVLIR